MPLTRRDLLSGACALCVLAGARAAGPVPVDPIKCGRLDDYPKDGVYDRYRSEGVLVVRKQGQLFFVSSICTHADGNLVAGRESSTIRCTKHKGVFDLDGNPIGGAPDEPLSRFGIKQDADGTLWADLTTRFSPKDFDSPTSYIAVPK